MWLVTNEGPQRTVDRLVGAFIVRNIVANLQSKSFLRLNDAGPAKLKANQVENSNFCDRTAMLIENFACLWK